MRRILIVGAGGHGKVVADALLAHERAGGQATPIGFLDDKDAFHGTMVLGLPVLGAVARLREIPHDAVILGVGDNRARRRLFERLSAERAIFAGVCHPAATMSAAVCLGDGVLACAGVVVNCDTRIGDNVILNTSCTVDHDCIIGNHVHIAPGARLGGEVRVGDGVLIGIGATVMPRREIGSGAIVGAGACVTRSVPAGVVVVGTPARVCGHAPTS